jgi:hypothetical protein
MDGKLGVRGEDAAAVAHRLALLLLPEDLPGFDCSAVVGRLDSVRRK